MPRAQKIYDYLDYRLWLKDSISHLQEKDSKFSQRWLAKRAGFKTPQLLSMIISGRRNLGEERIPGLARAFALNQRESEYLQIIVKLATVDSEQSRRDLMSSIEVGFRNGLFQEIKDEGLEVFRYWYLPTIREMAVTAGFNGDPETIAERLNIAAEEAERGLNLLCERGFLEQKEGQWHRASPSIHSFDNYSPMIIGKYTMEMIDRSLKAMSLPRDQRHFETLTFSIPRSLMPQLREEIRAFTSRIDALAEEQDHRDCVMHLNMQLFPTATGYQETS